MAGTKRSSTGAAEPKAKKAKVDSNASNGSPKGKTATKSDAAKPTAKKAKLPGPKTFKSDALPLHFNITHTPPSISKEDGKKDSIGHVVAIPTIFSTGSYGWKGNKKFTVNLKGGDGQEMTVQLNINATVLGSKDAMDDGKTDAKADKDDSEDEDEEEQDEEDDEE